MADYQRARSPQQKAERMSAIMDATETLFAQLPYHEINMGLIAKELGWSRSNLYKYAATQEEIMHLFVETVCIGKHTIESILYIQSEDGSTEAAYV